MPKGEIQNRDRDETSDLSGIPLAGGGLGELPEDLSRERGDLDTYALRAAENMAPDMASAQRGRVDAGETGVGSPKIDYSVRSIFDSRPINAREFNLWFVTDLESEPPPDLDIGVFAKSFFVPAGYVACLRGVTILLTPALVPEFNNYDGLLAISVNGAIVDPPQVIVGPTVGNSVLTQINIPFQSNQEVETFVLADENSSVGVFLDIGTQGQAFDSANMQVGFRGAFLLKTGVPGQFQAANEAGRARSAVVSTKNDLALTTGEGVTVRRRPRVPFPNVPILRK